MVRSFAMNMLGNGLSEETEHLEDALSVQEALLSMNRRLDASENDLLVVQSNLANTYCKLGRHKEALLLRLNAYSGRLRLKGEEDEETLRAAYNYAVSLRDLEHFKEAKALLREVIPVARRVLGEGQVITLDMTWVYASSLCNDTGATLDDLREAVTTLEDIERTARRVLGGAHPTTSNVEQTLRDARAALAARESDDVSSVCEAVAAANLRTA